MSAIGEAALAAFFQVLFEKLASKELLNFASEAKVRGEIDKWGKMLHKLRLVLEDAEEKQSQSRSVKEWLRDLKHLAYDVEDILDEFSTDCLRRKIMEEPQAASTSKIQKLISSCCTSFTPRAVMFNSDVMSRIRKITTRFDGILEEMEKFHLAEKVCGRTSEARERRESTSLQDEPRVYGRDGDKDKILEVLFKFEEATGHANVGIIPIVGMGGVGKTTLAKLVYNDNLVSNHFQVKAWVCVSDIFDIFKVTKGILESITLQSCGLTRLNDVQCNLKEQLVGKKFLLVLDDVWNDKYEDWHALRPPLMDGAPGSKIIVTTRSTNVAGIMGTIKHHELKGISNDDCWLLFARHAFENRSVVSDPELEKIGRDIVNKRCGGLPLAARTLGGLLRSKQRRNEWEEVLNSKMWKVSKGSDNILSALELSYYYLPSHLKRCFAYCAIIPKDYEFEHDEIIALWVAEGLILQDDNMKTMMDLSSSYFHDLLSRSLFQASDTDNTRFIMHDLVNDLALKVAEDTCVRLEDDVKLGTESNIERARYISYIQGYCDGIKKFTPFQNMKCLRTFLPLSLRSYKKYYLAYSVPNELLQNLRFVRVLSFSRYNIKGLPDAIGNLKHLRYLNLSHTEIEVLPDSVSSLYNLQTLILKECIHLKKLPTRIDNLINLCNLDIRRVQLIEGMPLEIKELRGLQTLSDFVVGKKESCTITTLMSLKSIGGAICISNLNNIVRASDARKARLSDKAGIHFLELRWNSHAVVEDMEDGLQYGVLEGLQPHKNLKKLIISYYAGTRFPSWIVDPMFNNITHLRLEDCKKCKSLPQFGMLQCLKELFIKNMSSLQKVDQDFSHNSCSNLFPSLEVLCFEDMLSWEEWNTSEFEFRVLRELSIGNCGKLSAKLPIHPLSLEKLVVRDCGSLLISFSSLPKLSALEINECKEVDFECKVDFSSLNMVVLSRISTIKNLSKGFVRRLKKFKNLTISRISSSNYGLITVPSSLSACNRRTNSGGCRVISTLECVIEACPQLVSMMIDEEEEQLLMELIGSELESLTLRSCDKLPAWVQKLFLKELIIKGSLSGLTVTSEEGLPSMLKVLQVGWFDACSRFPDLIVCNRQSLHELVIDHCEFLVSFGRRLLPPTLKKLRIVYCSRLQSLFDEDDCKSSSSSTNLEELCITNCDNLTSISSILEGNLLSKLHSLEISNSEKLESIGERFDHNTSLETFIIRECSSLKSLPDGIHNLINLRVFDIWSCPCIVSFPEGGLPTTYLKELVIRDLKRLEALPNNMPRLSSLQEFCLEDCLSLVSFPSLPSNLTKLRLWNLKTCKAVSEWELDRLNSLQELSILGGCGDMVSFPPDEKEAMLPSSLTILSILDFPNLECLSTRGFQNLTSLVDLFIWKCPKLASFPNNGLPDSLLELTVDDCPLLKQQIQKGKGHVWSNIRNNIPKVEF